MKLTRQQAIIAGSIMAAAGLGFGAARWSADAPRTEVHSEADGEAEGEGAFGRRLRRLAGRGRRGGRRRGHHGRARRRRRADSAGPGGVRPERRGDDRLAARRNGRDRLCGDGEPSGRRSADRGDQEPGRRGVARFGAGDGRRGRSGPGGLPARGSAAQGGRDGAAGLGGRAGDVAESRCAGSRRPGAAFGGWSAGIRGQDDSSQPDRGDDHQRRVRHGRVRRPGSGCRSGGEPGPSGADLRRSGGRFPVDPCRNADLRHGCDRPGDQRRRHGPFAQRRQRRRPGEGAHRPVSCRRPGTPVSGRALIGSSATLSVPTDAVQTVEGRPVVFVLDGPGFRARPVVPGRVAAGRTEIVRGLREGERVAGRGAFLLKAELSKSEAEHEH